MASDQVLHFLPMSYKKDTRLIWVKLWFEENMDIYSRRKMQTKFSGEIRINQSSIADKKYFKIISREHDYLYLLLFYTCMILIKNTNNVILSFLC